jgi:hypothetical protein
VRKWITTAVSWVLRQLGYAGRQENITEVTPVTDRSQALDSDAMRENVQKVLERVYRKIWNDWYADVPAATPATIVFELDASTSLYSHVLHEHRIGFGEVDAEELLNNDGLIPIATDGWPAWCRELVHEMLHEYQFRALNQQATPEGGELHTAHHRRFPGPRHDAVFFTAIARWAHYFDLTPEQLVERIC